MGYNLKAARLVVSLIGIVWGLTYGYKLLEFVRATELLWFLFWGTLPISVSLAILASVVEDD